MVYKFLKKINLNVDSMLKHGTVAFITMFGIWMLFGEDNIMLAFPIALTSAVLARQNLQVKTLNKIIKIIILDIFIVLVAFIVSNNFLFSIPLNLIFIFLIMFFIISPYDLTFYKPFLMLYVFSQYISIPLNELHIRIFSVIFGVLSVVIGENFIKKVNHKHSLINSLILSFNIILNQLYNIENKSFDEELFEKCTKITRELTYKIYITRYKKYLTTNLGKIQFEILLNIEYLNIILKNIYLNYLKERNYEENIEEIKIQIENIIKFLNEEISINILNNEFNKYIENNLKYKDFIYNKKLLNVFRLLNLNINELNSLNKKDFNKVYKEWEKSSMEKSNINFKKKIEINTIRFKFAARMSIVLSFTLFIGKFFSFYKIIWFIITIMSIMQPYYEDTILKTKERIKGNIIAILFFYIFFYVINIKYITIIILISSLYLIFAFKEYNKISIFTAIVSLSIASFYTDMNEIAIYRIIYVILGVLLVMLVNKYIFPYKLNDGIIQLMEKINNYKNLLEEENKKNNLNTINKNKIRELIIHLILLNHKLYMRNIQFNNLKVKNLINENNTFIILIGYNILFNE